MALLLLSGLRAAAQTGTVQGSCQFGGVFPSLFGSLATQPFLASYPSCTVTVFLTGTSTLATIYSTNTNTPLANPFTASANTGAWLFWSALAVGVDVQMSGGSPTAMPSPFTLTDVFPQGTNASGTITGATANGGLVVTGSTLGLLTSCSNGQTLVWTSGTASWGCGGGAGGPVTGSGTSGTIPLWTGVSTLGNSSVTDDGTTVSTSERFQVNGNNTAIAIKSNNGSMDGIVSPSSCGGTGGATVFTFLPCTFAIRGTANVPAATTGYMAGVLGEITNVLTFTGTPSFAALAGNANPGGSGNFNWVAGVVGTSIPATTGTTANDSGVVGVGIASTAAGTTLLDGLDAQIVTQVNATTATGAGLLVRSPSLTNGTVTNLRGILVQDQTGGGGLNPNPVGIVVQGGGVEVSPHTFSTLPTCSATYEGRMEAVSDATSATNGATVAGSGTHHVLAYCNSVNWLVVVGT